MDAGDHEYAEGSRAMREQRYADAVHLFSKAVFLCPSEPLPYVSRAEAYVCLSDVRSAIANYRKALSIMEDTASAGDLRRRLSQLLDAAGLVAFSRGNTSAALTLVGEALQECPHPLIELHRAVYLIGNGDNGPAEAILRRVLEKDPEEVQPEASTLLARLLISTRRDFSGAKALIEEVAAQYPNDKSTMQAQHLFATAFARFRSNAERTLNVTALGKAIDAFPDDGALYYTRAMAHCEEKAYTLAVQDLFVCINKSDGTDVDAAQLMSRVLATIGDDLSETDDLTSAIHYYSESLKWCGDDPIKEVLLARGDCLALLSRHEEALGDYKRVHQLDPLQEGARSRLGHLHDVHGSALYNEGNYLVAEEEFTRAIEYFDQTPTFFFHRALSRGMLGKGAMMVRDLLSCKHLGTDNPQITGMIQQFCAESTSAEGRHMRDATEEEARVEAELARFREANSVLRRRERRDQRPVEEDFRLGTLRTMGREVLDGGVLTPANIRHFVRNMQVSKASAVTVHTNAITSQRTINGKDAQAVEREERHKPHWAVSQRKVQSRWDKVVVSKPSPPPAHLYRGPVGGQYKAATSSVEMERYRRKDDGMYAAPVVNQASAARRAPLAPMNSGALATVANNSRGRSVAQPTDGGLLATTGSFEPFIVARPAPTSDRLLPRISAPSTAR